MAATPKWWIDLSAYNLSISVLQKRTPENLLDRRFAIYALDTTKPIDWERLSRLNFAKFTQKDGYWLHDETIKPEFLTRDFWLPHLPQTTFFQTSESNQSVIWETEEEIQEAARRDQKDWISMQQSENDFLEIGEEDFTPENPNTTEEPLAQNDMEEEILPYPEIREETRVDGIVVTEPDSNPEKDDDLDEQEEESQPKRGRAPKRNMEGRLESGGREIPFSRKDMAEKRKLSLEEVADEFSSFSEESIKKISKWQGTTIGNSRDDALILENAKKFKRDKIIGTLKERLLEIEKSDNDERKKMIVKALYQFLPATPDKSKKLSRASFTIGLDTIRFTVLYIAGLHKINEKLDELIKNPLSPQVVRDFLFPNAENRGDGFTRSSRDAKWAMRDMELKESLLHDPSWKNILSEEGIFDYRKILEEGFHIDNEMIRPGNFLQGDFRKNAKNSPYNFYEALAQQCIVEFHEIGRGKIFEDVDVKGKIFNLPNSFIDNTKSNFPWGEVDKAYRLSESIEKTISNSFDKYQAKDLLDLVYLNRGYCRSIDLSNLLESKFFQDRDSDLIETIPVEEIITKTFWESFSFLRLFQEKMPEIQKRLEEVRAKSGQEGHSPKNNAPEEVKHIIPEGFWKMDIPEKEKIFSDQDYMIGVGEHGEVEMIYQYPEEDPSPRMGENITVERFIQDTGFSGVQFGEYVPQNHRQDSLNQLYDGIHMLAKILDVPVRSLAVPYGENGPTLAIAIGARGGGRFWAHYEPHESTHVINLTSNPKNRKGMMGVFAHEWLHALDASVAKSQGHGFFSSEQKGTTHWDFLDKIKTKDALYGDERLKENENELPEKIENSEKITILENRNKKFLTGKKAEDFSRSLENLFRSFEKSIKDQDFTFVPSSVREVIKEKGVTISLDDTTKILREMIHDIYDKYADLVTNKEISSAECSRECQRLGLVYTMGSKGLLVQYTEEEAVAVREPKIQEAAKKLGMNPLTPDQVSIVSAAYGRAHELVGYYAMKSAELHHDFHSKSLINMRLTRFNLDAEILDLRKTKSYWASRRELFARAGQAAMMDIAKSKGFENGFLFALSMPERYKGTASPNPEYPEREFITKHFSEMVLPKMRLHLLQNVQKRFPEDCKGFDFPEEKTEKPEVEKFEAVKKVSGYPDI